MAGKAVKRGSSLQAHRWSVLRACACANRLGSMQDCGRLGIDESTANQRVGLCAESGSRKRRLSCLPSAERARRIGTGSWRDRHERWTIPVRRYCCGCRNPVCRSSEGESEQDQSDPKTGPPDVAWIHPNFSPSREDLEEDLRIDATLEELGKAFIRTVRGRHATSLKRRWSKSDVGSHGYGPLDARLPAIMARAILIELGGGAAYPALPYTGAAL